MIIEHIYISEGHNFYGRHGQEPLKHPMVSVDQVECVAGSGLKGDRFFNFKDDYRGQVTFFSMDVYEQICAGLQVYDREPWVFRRNVIVSGVDLNSLIGQEFDVQGIRFAGTVECSPCAWMDKVFGEGAEGFLKGQGGLRARILSDGVLKIGA